MTQLSAKKAEDIAERAIQICGFTQISRDSKDFADLRYMRQSSQKPHDFLLFVKDNTGELVTIRIEVKKTDSNTVMLNDTAPVGNYFLVRCNKRSRRLDCMLLSELECMLLYDTAAVAEYGGHVKTMRKMYKKLGFGLYSCTRTNYYLKWKEIKAWKALLLLSMSMVLHMMK